MLSMKPALAALGLAILVPAVDANEVTLTPSQDNTMFSESNTLSNGAGSYVFCGRIAFGPDIRRALLQFDVAGSIPVGSTINSVQLRLNLSNTIATAETCSVYLVSESWGEGTSNSDSVQGGGQGDAATAGDATWSDRIFPGTVWTTTGGTFSGTASASTSVDNLFGFFTWGSTAAMVSDVQGWVDTPASNNGWILRGNEASNVTAKRFDSKDNIDPSVWPQLIVNYTPPTVRFCDASDGSLASCPCSNPGNADSGCDIAQGTGGVQITVLAHNTAPNGATVQGSGFSTMGSPTAIVIRSSLPNLGAPVVFGDGVRCLDEAAGLVRLGQAPAIGGLSTHTFGNGAMAGSGSKHYQIWFRNNPSTFCDATAAFNLSNGATLVW